MPGEFLVGFSQRRIGHRGGLAFAMVGLGQQVLKLVRLIARHAGRMRPALAGSSDALAKKLNPAGWGTAAGFEGCAKRDGMGWGPSPSPRHNMAFYGHNQG